MNTGSKLKNVSVTCFQVTETVMTAVPLCLTKAHQGTYRPLNPVTVGSGSPYSPWVSVEQLTGAFPAAQERNLLSFEIPLW